MSSSWTGTSEAIAGAIASDNKQRWRKTNWWAGFKETLDTSNDSCCLLGVLIWQTWFRVSEGFSGGYAGSLGAAQSRHSQPRMTAYLVRYEKKRNDG